jgi:hypothetical protein
MVLVKTHAADLACGVEYKLPVTVAIVVICFDDS